jgi:Fe-S oxidoreductase
MAVTTTAPTSEELVQQVMELSPRGEHIRTCLQCGSCTGICPYGFAMDYPPRSIIAALRANDLEPVLESDTIWLCMSCFACTASCPADIPLAEALMSLMKYQMLVKGDVPAELKTALENSRRYGNVLGQSPKKRAEWTQKLDFPVPLMAAHKAPIDVLWYVGDFASYHPRAQLTAIAAAKVLHALGVEFGILGPEEIAHGDPQCVLAGEHGLFELLASKNTKTFAKYDYGELITTSPHALNAFSNEYPKLGYELEVRHYTQFLAKRIDQLKPLMKKELPLKVAYHDPCCLGRAHGNHIYQEPRALLEAIPGVEIVEMAHKKEQSICCGGGGGGMWLDGFTWEKTKTRTSEWRIEEAVAAGAQMLAVACPYECPRFEDAAKSLGKAEGLQVKDISELLAEAMDL